MCRLYQKDFTGSALATDNRTFILFPTFFNLTPTFSSQQSEVTTAVAFSYQTITRHLPPLRATANVELFSITNFVVLKSITQTFIKVCSSGSYYIISDV